MRFLCLGLVFHRGLALGALLFISEHRLHFSPPIKTSRQFFALSFIQFRFLAFYRASLRNWGTVNGTQTGISKTFILIYYFKIQERLTTSSSLSCNPCTERFSIQFHMVGYCGAIKLKILIT